MKLYFKINERLKKIFNYFSIFTIVLGTTFGSLNSAYADAVADLDVIDADGAGAVAANVAIDDVTDDLIIANDATAATVNLKDGDLEVDLVTSNTAAAFTLTVTDPDGSGTFIISDDISQADGAGNLIIKTSDDSTTITVESNMTDSTGDGEILVQLDDTDILNVEDAGNPDGEGAQTIQAKIDGIEAGEGELQSGGTAVTYADKIGSNFALKLVDIDDGATFEETVVATDITIDDSAVFEAAVTGAIDLDGDVDFESDVTGSITGTDAANTVDFDGTTAQTITGSIVAETDGDIIVKAANTAGVTVVGNVGDSGGNGIATLDVDKDLTIQGESHAAAVDVATGATLTIDDDFDVGTATLNTTGKVVFNTDGVAAATTVAGAITGGGVGEGTIQTTNTGGTTFSGAIGANDLLLVDVDATSTFSSTVDAVALTADATTTVTGNAGIDTITITGATANFAGTVATTGGAENDIILADGTAKVVFTGAKTYTTAITSSTTSEGTVQLTGVANIVGSIGTDADNTVATLDVDESSSISGSVFVDATTVSDSDVLTFDGGAAQTVTGTIDSNDSDTDGDIAVSATVGGVTFSGAIGSNDVIAVLDDNSATTYNGTVNATTITLDDSSLADGVSTFNEAVTATTVTIGTASAKAVNFKKNLTATTITAANAADAITFNGTSAQTIAGTIDGAAGIAGVVTSNNAAGTTFSGKLGNTQQLTKIDTATGAKSVFSETVDTALFAVTGTGSATLSKVSNVATNLTLASGSTLILDDTIADTNTIFTTTNSMVDGSVHASSKIKMPSNFDNGETINLFIDVLDAEVADIVTDVNSALVDTGLVDYVATASDDDVIVTATETTDSAAATSLSVTTNEAKALRQARSAMIGTAADLDTLTDVLSLENGNTATDRTNFADQVAPQDDMISGSTFATKAMTGSLQGIMSNRMASLRSGEAYYGSGMSAGANMSANSGFLQVFGTDAEQKNKTVGSGTQFGYDTTSSGVALGFDGITDNGSVVGLSLSMSETDVDGKGTGKSKNDIDSYTASIYMDKSTDAGYVEGSLTVGLNENNSSRIVNTAGLDRTYKGDYDSEQVSLKIGGGKPNAVGMSGYVTPFGSITATRISTDAYTETSTTANDNLRLRVAQDDVDSIVGTVGLKYHNVLDNGGSPMISLAINNEFGDSTINSTNTYQGGGSSFKTSTDVEELSATLGLGYSFSSDNTSIEFAYEADANDDDYLSHYGSIKLVSKF